MSTFFDFPVTGINGEPDLLGPLRGRVVLAVNVASRCGYTPQYTGLERLHGELAAEGNGTHRHPVFAWLTAPANGHPGDLAWNFEKFLVGRDGRLVARYPSGTKPEDKGLMTDIANAL
jgi:glutathione peroxidase